MQEFGAGFGSIYYTPGESNTGIPNFSENSMYSLPVSYGADGYNRVSWVDWSTNGKDGFTHMIPEIQTYSAMAYGEYTLSGEANLTPYFEVMYSQRDSQTHTAPLRRSTTTMAGVISSTIPKAMSPSARS